MKNYALALSLLCLVGTAANAEHLKSLDGKGLDASISVSDTHMTLPTILRV